MSLNDVFFPFFSAKDGYTINPISCVCIPVPEIISSWQLVAIAMDPKKARSQVYQVPIGLDICQAVAF